MESLKNKNIELVNGFGKYSASIKEVIQFVDFDLNSQLSIYNKVKELGYSEKYQIVAILQDILENKCVSYEYLLGKFDKDIVEVIKILDIDKIKGSMYEFDAVKEACKNEIAMVVKFADRLSKLEQAFLGMDSRYIERILLSTEFCYLPNYSGKFKLALRNEVIRLKNLAI